MIGLTAAWLALIFGALVLLLNLACMRTLQVAWRPFGARCATTITFGLRWAHRGWWFHNGVRPEHQKQIQEGVHVLVSCLWLPRWYVRVVREDRAYYGDRGLPREVIQELTRPRWRAPHHPVSYRSNTNAEREYGA